MRAAIPPRSYRPLRSDTLASAIVLTTGCAGETSGPQRPVMTRSEECIDRSGIRTAQVGPAALGCRHDGIRTVLLHGARPRSAGRSVDPLDRKGNPVR